MNPGSILGIAGDTFTLQSLETDIDCNGHVVYTYTVGGTQNLQYSSDDQSVATVSGDTVTFVGAGEANIRSNWDALSMTQHCFLSAEGECVDATCTSNQVNNPLADILANVLAVTFIDVSEVGGSTHTDFFGGVPFATLNINSCGGERFGVKIRFRPSDPNTTINNVDSTVSSTGMFALAPSPVDNTYVEYFGNDNPPYTITYLRKVRSSGNRAVTHTVEGTSNGRAFRDTAVVTLVCQ